MTIIEKILIGISVILVFNMYLKKVEEHHTVEINKSSVKQSSNEIQKIMDLGITFQYFRDDYNKFAEEYEVPQLSLKNLHWDTKSEVETFYCYLGNTVVVLGDIDKKNGQLITVTVSCVPKESVNEKESIMRATVVYSFVIMTLSPELNQTDSERIIKRMSSNLKNYSVLEDDIRYRSRIHNGILMFSAEGKDYKK